MGVLDPIYILLHTFQVLPLGRCVLEAKNTYVISEEMQFLMDFL